MASFDELKELLIVRLYERASKANVPSEIYGLEIIGLLEEETGVGIATQVYLELFNPHCPDRFVI
jgi:hypothetical protein